MLGLTPCECVDEPHIAYIIHYVATMYFSFLKYFFILCSVYLSTI